MSGSEKSNGSAASNSHESFVSDSRFNSLYPPAQRHKHWHDRDLYWATPSSKSAWGDTYSRMASSRRNLSSPIPRHISNADSVNSYLEESQLPPSPNQYSLMFASLLYSCYSTLTSL